MACLGPNAMFSTGEHSASMCTHRDSGFSSPSLQQLGSKSVKKQTSCGSELSLGGMSAASLHSSNFVFANLFKYLIHHLNNVSQYPHPLRSLSYMISMRKNTQIFKLTPFQVINRQQLISIKFPNLTHLSSQLVQNRRETFQMSLIDKTGIDVSTYSHLTKCQWFLHN